jgi:hypothetical protein
MLNQNATPEQIARVNELIRDIREHFKLACAWEHVDPDAVREHVHFGEDNPYRDGYELAMHRYIEYRRIHVV